MCVRISKIGRGIGHRSDFCPPMTAGITINENADPDVRDLLDGYEKVFPTQDGNYRHFEGKQPCSYEIIW